MNAPVQARDGQAALDPATVRTIVIGIMLAMLLAALDQTIVATALPTIGSELGNLQNLSWVVTAYLLSSTAVTPLYGKLSDIHGRRLVLLVAIAIFIIGSVACALSTAMLPLILSRFLQGLGGGGLISLAQTIIGDAVPPRERSRYMGYFGAVFALSSVLGPVLGGYLTEWLGWASIFWINIPLGLLAFAMTFSALKKLPRNERPHRIDYVGAMLLVVAAVTLLLVLSWGGHLYPWASPTILGLVAASLVAWALFGLRLARAAEPFLPLSLLRDRVVATATLAVFFGVGAMVSLTIYLPVFFQSAFGLSPGRAGLALIAFSCGVVAGAQTSGRTMAHTERYKRIPLAGVGLTVLATLFLAIMAERLSFAGVEIVLFLMGIGVGTIFPVALVAVQNAVKPHQLGMATGTMNFMRALGSSVLVAFFGTIFLSGLGAFGSHNSVEEIAAAARQSNLSLAGAFQGVFFAAAACFAIAFLFIVLMEERPLRGREPATAKAD